MDKQSPFPKALVAVDQKRQRVFVLAVPHISALFKDDEWQYVEPLSDDEIAHYELVTDPAVIARLVNQAREALFAGVPGAGLPTDKIN